MGKEATAPCYEPDPAFEEVKEEAMLDLTPTGSKEFWLIQWIKDKDLDVSEFHGKDVSLELKRDGNRGSLESSSDKVRVSDERSYQESFFIGTGAEINPSKFIFLSIFCGVYNGIIFRERTEDLHCILSPYMVLVC